MSTSEPPFLPPGQDVAQAQLTKEIERIANEIFQAPPGPAPNAMNVGAGGISPSAALPTPPAPMPSAVGSFPLIDTHPNAHAPPLDRTQSPTTLAPPGGGISSPSVPSEATPGPSFPGQRDDHSGEVPYFVQIARGVPPESPALPSASTTPPGREVTTAEPVVDRPLAGLSHEFQPEVVPHVAAPHKDIFDAHAVKRDFPILHQTVNGKPLVWLDNAATTQKPNAVIDRIARYYRTENSNVHRAAHTLAARSTDAYEGARKTVQRFLGAPRPDEIVFVRGATEGINLIAKAWGARNVEAGDEVLITNLEHHANIVPWQQLCSLKGAKLRVAPVDSKGQILLEEFEKLLNQRTKIVAFTQVSNALGTITPAKEMIDMAHRWGAMVALDGAQAVSHMPVDVQALDCDFYSFSGHKIFAPMGIGAVYGKNSFLSDMPPWQGGGNMIQDVTFEKTTYQGPPWRFEAGTGSIADAVGLAAALDYVSGLGLPRIAEHEHELRVYAEGCLNEIRGVKIIGNAADKAGVISFVLDGHKTEEVGGLLDLEGIAVRSGHHCAQPILRRFGLESTVRASLAPYNTREDVDALVTAVRRLQEGRPGGYVSPRERNFELKQTSKS